MNLELTAFITLVCTSGVLNLCLSLYVFFKRHNYTNISYLFILYSASITIYCFGSGFGLTATTLEQIKFWTVIQYIGMPLSPPLGLLFIMQYLDRKITKKLCIFLFSIPLISLAAVATNDLHHFHYRVFEVDPVLGVPYIHQEIGVWYMIHGVFTFSCMFAALLLVLSHWKDTAKVYRPQIISLIFGQFIPIVTAFIYLIGFTPPGVDPVPMVLWISSLLYFWSIGTSRMFSIMPITKSTIFNSINDGVMVLDESYRLIEFNQACKRMFSDLNNSMFGMGFDKVWVKLSGESFPHLLTHGIVTLEVELTADRSNRVYQIRTSSLVHPNYNKGVLMVFTEVTELKRLQSKLEHQAYHDELTNILNRRAFFQKCDQEFSIAKAALSPFSIILIDIDHFKNVNDTHGHIVGDQLLMHVVTACQTQINDGILFARYGGEEFVLALKGTLREAEKLADQLRRHIETQPLLVVEGEISVTLSSGVAEASKETEETLYELLNKADEALYSAKRNGRNQVHAYTLQT